MLAVTHSGKFHADDVLAWALIRTFFAPDAELIRTRDEMIMHNADIVFDVGGIFDPTTMRFDHHQATYQGELSSAGMVLHWLFEQGHISETLFSIYKNTIVDYVDDVDNGRTLPQKGVPCFAQLVDMMGSGCDTLEAFDVAFHKAAHFAQEFIQSIHREHLLQEKMRGLVLEEMKQAQEEGRNYLLFEEYVPWKKPYFQAKGADHLTEFIIFPSLQNRWQAVAIPPEENSFAQKRSLPTEWSGLRDEELSAVIGIDGCIFCHKNLFIAVFDTKETAFAAMKKWKLIS